jgi:hypothetical protein
MPRRAPGSVNAVRLADGEPLTGQSLTFLGSKGSRPTALPPGPSRMRILAKCPWLVFKGTAEEEGGSGTKAS